MIRFSVFLPVRNGWPYVQECVESILAQSYPHLELHVLDNQSTDNTVQYLKSLTDDRVRVSYSSSDLSIVESWARVKELDKLEYMTLIGHDDLFDQNFLETIKELIDLHPDAALYQTGSRFINSAGKIIRDCKDVPEYETADQYLKSRFTNQRDVFGTGCVMRSADYDRVGGIPPFEKLFFADDALWLSLLEGSYKASNPAQCFSVRIHPKSESASLPSIWSSSLLGFNQFTDFLASYVAQNDKARLAVAEFGPTFFLKYHQDLLIFALIESAQLGRKIDPDIIEQINASLAASAPDHSKDLYKSAKVTIIQGLSSSQLRWVLPIFWSAYNSLKSGTA